MATAQRWSFDGDVAAAQRRSFDGDAAAAQLLSLFISKDIAFCPGSRVYSACIVTVLCFLLPLNLCLTPRRASAAFATACTALPPPLLLPPSRYCCCRRLIAVAAPATATATAASCAATSVSSAANPFRCVSSALVALYEYQK